MGYRRTERKQEYMNEELTYKVLHLSWNLVSLRLELPALTVYSVLMTSFALHVQEHSRLALTNMIS